MKITKILEILNPITKTVNPSKGLEDRRSAFDAPEKKIGSGKYGLTAKSHNPHEVIKLSSHNNNRIEDHYNFFVDAVLAYNKNNGEMNPYFPHFYKIVTAKEKGETNDMRQKKIIRMERLQPMSSCSAEELYLMGIHSFGEYFKKKLMDELPEVLVPNSSWEEELRKIYNNKYHNKPSIIELDLKSLIKGDNPRLKNSLIGIITFIVDSNLNDPDPVRIKDLRLLDALEWLYQCMIEPSEIGYNNANPGNDIHRGNIMIRRGRGFPQLVITDPYY